VKAIFNVVVKFILGAKKGSENTQSKDTDSAEKAVANNG
jgi:hypothetical protein